MNSAPRQQDGAAAPHQSGAAPGTAPRSTQRPMTQPHDMKELP